MEVEPAVKHWVLKIEIDGEWEQCVFTTREQALAAFVALAADYKFALRRAVLFPSNLLGEFLLLCSPLRSARSYVN